MTGGEKRKKILKIKKNDGLANRKDNALFTGLNNIDWGKSTDNRGVKQKLTPYDMAGMLSRPTENTQPKSAHTILNGEVANTSGEKLLLEQKVIVCFILKYA